MSETKIGKNHLIPAASKVIAGLIIINIVDLYNQTPQKKKAHVLSLVACEFSLKELLSFGFNISQNQLNGPGRLTELGKHLCLLTQELCHLPEPESL